MIKLFMLRLVEHWERLLSEVAVPPALNILKFDGNTLSYLISLLS